MLLPQTMFEVYHDAWSLPLETWEKFSALEYLRTVAANIRM